MDSPARSEGDSQKLPHDFLVATGQQMLLIEGIEAQKGSRAAAGSLLETADWLKAESILQEVSNEIEKSGRAAVRRGQDGSPVQISFNKPIPDYPGYPKIDVTLDVEREQVNGKNRAQLKSQANAERREFVDAIVDASNRKLPEKGKKPLTAGEKKLLKTLEESLIAGELAPIRRAFQSSSGNTALWKRMAAEIELDINSPPPLRLKTGKENGNSLEIVGENENSLDLVVIPAKGDAQAKDIDGNPVAESTDKVMSRQTAYRLGFIDRKQSDYRCDFDAHERKNRVSSGKVSLKTIVEKYNGYSRHLCGDESID